MPARKMKVLERLARYIVTGDPTLTVMAVK